MGSYEWGPIMAYGPCLNPNCKSQGRPHPNCKCYGTLAKGGQVSNFCDSKRSHEKTCEYFAEGGDVAKDSSPPFGFTVDSEDSGSNAAATEAPTGFTLDQEKAPDQGLPQGFELDDTKYTTPGEKLGTAVEGAIQGVPIIGPLATAAEVGLGKLQKAGYIAPGTLLPSTDLSSEDIAGRAAANPSIHEGAKAVGLIGSLASGYGAAAKGASLGATALTGLLSGIGQGSSDEATNWILGQTDPHHPVAASLLNTGANGLFSLLGSSAAYKATSKLAEIAPKAGPFLEGVAAAASGKGLEEGADPIAQAGAKFYNGLAGSLFPHVGAGLGGFEGGKEGYERHGVMGIPAGAAIGAASGAATEWLGKNIVNKITSAVGKNAVAPFIAKIIGSGGVEGLDDAVTHAANVKAGMDKLNGGIEGLFRSGSSLGNLGKDDAISNENREATKDYIKNGGYQQNIDQTIQDQNNQPASVPQFAEGGEIPPPGPPPVPTDKNKIKSIFHNVGLSTHFPAQEAILTGAKSRVSSYLNSMAPSKFTQKLPFDAPPDNTRQERSYNKAIDIANNPMSVFDHIQQGTIEPEHLQHLNAIYPEVHDLMKKKLTDRIIKAQMAGEKPTYKIRQGMSLLLGANLGSETTPQNIQAAQAVFASQSSQPSGTPVTKNKKNTSTLSKVSSQYLTPNQARAQGAQKD